MNKSEQQYADELVEQYRMRIGSKGFVNFKIICVNLAINDVNNTIEAIDWHEFEVPNKQLEYYNNVLQILKDRL